MLHEPSGIKTDIIRDFFLPNNMRRALKIILGIFLVLVGVLALLTPLTPGSWLALIGLELLGLRILLERKLISILPPKYRRKVRNLFKRRVKKS
jgi:drug/metabolite transporter (DMT)-like permease